MGDKTTKTSAGQLQGKVRTNFSIVLDVNKGIKQTLEKQMSPVYSE